MGILNVTPDSFFSQSRVPATHSAQILARARDLVAGGAAILDIGGYSTRPGAPAVEKEEELGRVLPAIQAIRENIPEAFISIDTFRAEVAGAAVRAGAHIVNDVSGGDLDPGMFETVARLKVPYILMHMRGTPETMNQLTHYTDVTADILSELRRKLAGLRSLGVADIIIDPGFGFAKTAGQNFELLARLDAFHKLGCPVLAGLSRKSAITKTLGVTPEKALNGTTVLNTIALMKGAHLLRVHDPAEAREAVILTGKVRKYNL